MATNDATRVNRTRRDIKAALLVLLEKQSLDMISMSEIAREAHVSRSTLYQHYNNAREIYEEIVGEFKAKVAPEMTQMACFEGIEEEGTKPFCEHCRSSVEYRALIDSPCFMDTYLAELRGNHDFLDVLMKAGYTEEMALALAVFQVNGCFKAVKRYGADETKWREVREAIDAFVCGGLAECVARKQAERGH